MKTLTYQGPAGLRILDDIEFPHGIPVEVSNEAAKAILDGPHADEFTTTPGKDG